jgi:DNA-binding NtrC family response regulator
LSLFAETTATNGYQKRTRGDILGSEHQYEVLRQRLGLQRLIGRNPAFRQIVELIVRIAGEEVSVVITGETGTGKELCARAIHYHGHRRTHPFVPVNCGAVPTEIAESELFGHVRGAFTHAHANQRGLVEQAEGGTLFLDEVDALPPQVQIKLLRFLQDREYRALGSTHIHHADVRVIAAANGNLADAVSRGKFRRDLYYRINTVAMRVPPLRERREDIELLAHHFLRKHSGSAERPARRFSDAALRALVAHDWPGNVRELEHVIERALVLATGPIVDRPLLDLPATSALPPHSFREAKARTVARFEREYVEQMLAVTGGNISRAAAAAKKNRRTFWELIRKHGIDAERFRPSG